MLELKIIDHCAPTLAGLKTGNLFNYRFTSIDGFREELEAENQKLNRKGVFIEVLKENKMCALLYVYRKKKLECDLKKAGVSELLKGFGYIDSEVETCLEQLKKRLIQQENFPHEIGVFLSYPLHDVIGFIEQDGKNCLFCGMWKVYCNECEAVKMFMAFQKCTEVYRRVFANGRTITQLTVAA